MQPMMQLFTLFRWGTSNSANGASKQPNIVLPCRLIFVGEEQSTVHSKRHCCKSLSSIETEPRFAGCRAAVAYRHRVNRSPPRKARVWAVVVRSLPPGCGQYLPKTDDHGSSRQRALGCFWPLSLDGRSGRTTCTGRVPTRVGNWVVAGRCRAATWCWCWCWYRWSYELF